MGGDWVTSGLMETPEDGGSVTLWIAAAGKPESGS